MKRREWILIAAAVLGLASRGAAADDGAALTAYLDECGQRYSEERALLGLAFSSPGYHTTVASGTWVHSVLPSFDYALGLLMRSAPADRQRAEKVLRKAISLQDTDPASRTYGIWPWLLEEPLAKMSPPDWNWADFCGARLALVLADHADAVPDDLRQSLRASLKHAAAAIQKRNVGPSYTNIAIMGGGVCAAAGELLREPAILEYGRRRLEKVVAHTEYHGGFNEYNSPTYTMVALVESERTLHLVRDPATRKAAESLRQTAWKAIAESYHPGTAQWAGPHARSYSDYVFPRVAAYVTEQAGVPIPVHPSADRARTGDLPVSWHLPCPADLKARFRAIPSDPLEVRRSFVRGNSPEASTIGTTWQTADACLGSVNRGTFWTQCRPVIGYWKTDADPAVVLRVRFLHDGRDFASMGVRTSQTGGKCLLAAYPLRGAGDWHPILDRPAAGLFQAADFRLRIELTGKEVAIEKLQEATWELRAGKRRAVVHALPGRFAGQDVVWTTGAEAGRVFLDGVCYQGPKQSFDFQKLPEVVLAAGLEILAPTAAPSAPPQVSQPAPETVEAAWGVAEGLKLTAPTGRAAAAESSSARSEKIIQSCQIASVRPSP